MDEEIENQQVCIKLSFPSRSNHKALKYNTTHLMKPQAITIHPK